MMILMLEKIKKNTDLEYELSMSTEKITPVSFPVTFGKMIFYFDKDVEPEIGFLKFDYENRNKISISDFRIYEDKRNRGFGKKILDTFFAIFDRPGVEYRLLVSPREKTTTFEGLWRLYRSAGFEEDSEDRNYAIRKVN